MSVTATAAARLAQATRYVYKGTDPSGKKLFQAIYADDPAPQPSRTSYGPTCRTKVLIQDPLHPWVTMAWCDDLPLPPGWVQGGSLDTLARNNQPLADGGTSIVPFTVPDAEVQALIRQASREAAAAALADLREQKQILRDENLRNLFAPRIVPGATRPRPPRTPRKPRAPRAARPPRTPRAPRTPRTPGTKNTDPKKRPCKHRNSLGQCADKGCIASATIPEPNVGHSSCNWGPVDSCGNCVQQGCTGPAASVLKPLLSILPKYWTVESVQKVQDERQAKKVANQQKRQFAQLPKISQQIGGATAATATPSASGGPCCVCQDWPGWVICAGCGHSYKCTCHGACTPIPPGMGYGY